jgi:hypothetical protein
MIGLVLEEATVNVQNYVAEATCQVLVVTPLGLIGGFAGF